MKINKRELIMMAVIIVLSLLFVKSCSDKNKVNEINEVLNDELELSTNKLGQQSATIQALQVQNELQFLTIQTKDSTIQWLQILVKDYRGKLEHALVLSNNTGSTGSTVTVIEYDTVTEIKYPIYSTTWENKWERGFIRATSDSIYREIKINNEYEITVGKEKTGFLKRAYQVRIKNLNPNTNTTELRNVSIQPKQRRIGIGLHAGYGITGKGLTWYAGGGLYFRIL